MKSQTTMTLHRCWVLGIAQNGAIASNPSSIDETSAFSLPIVSAVLRQATSEALLNCSGLARPYRAPVPHTAVDGSESRNAQAQVMVVSQVAFRACRGLPGHRHLTGHGVQANVGVALFWSFSLPGVN